MRKGKTFWFISSTSESKLVRPAMCSTLKTYENIDIERLKINSEKLLPTKRACDVSGYLEPYYDKQEIMGTPHASLFEGDGGARSLSRTCCSWSIRACVGGGVCERAEARDARERAKAREARERAGDLGACIRALSSVLLLVLSTIQCSSLMNCRIVAIRVKKSS
jgi:hypothetical protein